MEGSKEIQTKEVQPQEVQEKELENKTGRTKKEVPIIELIELINANKLTRKEVLARYNISGKTFTRLIKENGYTYNPSKKIYVKKEEPKGLEPQELSKITYLIPADLHKSLKLQAIFEGKTATEIIIKALEEYIPATTKELSRNYKGKE